MIDHIIKNSGIWLINNIVIDIKNTFNSCNLLGKIIIYPFILSYYLFQLFLAVLGLFLYSILEFFKVLDLTSIVCKFLSDVFNRLFKR
jgi:hypothetical protein